MNPIQDEAYTEMHKQIDYLTWLVAEERKTLDEMSALLLRAATTLEDKQWNQVTKADLELVAEMRRMAQ